MRFSEFSRIAPVRHALVVLCALLVGEAGATDLNVDDLRNTAPDQRVQELVERFSAAKSRVAGYPGAEDAARFIQQNFRDAGLHDITVHEFDVSVPVEKHGSLRLAAAGEPVPLHGIWPNLVKTSSLPDGGRHR